MATNSIPSRARGEQKFRPFAFDIRSEDAAKQAGYALSRTGNLNFMPPWADPEKILSAYWKVRLIRDRGGMAKVEYLTPASDGGLIVENNLCISSLASDAFNLADVHLEFQAEKAVVQLLGWEDFHRLCRLEMGPSWYEHKFPSAPGRRHKAENVCEADLRNAGVPNCRLAKIRLTQLRAEELKKLRGNFVRLFDHSDPFGY